MVNALSSTFGRPWTRTAAMVVAFALLLGAALQLAVSADAETRTITRVSAARDALGIDYDRNGTATSTRYNMGDPTISVGESPAASEWAAE